MPEPTQAFLISFTTHSVGEILSEICILFQSWNRYQKQKENKISSVRDITGYYTTGRLNIKTE